MKWGRPEKQYRYAITFIKSISTVPESALSHSVLHALSQDVVHRSISLARAKYRIYEILGVDISSNS